MSICVICGQTLKNEEHKIKRTAPTIKILLGSELYPPKSLMPFNKGTTVPGSDIYFDTQKVNNGHFLIAGPSGSGKSYQMMRIGQILAQSGAKLHVIDVHGDLEFAPSLVDTIIFSETSKFGLPPLDIIDDPEIGGVNRRINTFLRLIEQAGATGAASTALGSRQRSSMDRVLEEMYQRFGFEIDNPKTWNLVGNSPGGLPKRYPNLTDLRDHLWNRLIMVKTGSSLPAVRSFQNFLSLCATRTRLRAKMVSNNIDEEAKIKIEADMADAREKAITEMRVAMETADSGVEIEEIIHWDNNSEQLAALHERIRKLERSGIFKGTPPPFARNKPVWRYDLKSLSDGEQKLFVECLLEKIFIDAKRAGITSGPDTFVMIDESHKFVVNDGDHILNRLVKEARKFGIGLILGSQSFLHFSDDLLQSAATKLVLGCADTYQEPMRKRLAVPMRTLPGKKVKTNPLSEIIPKKTAIVFGAQQSQNYTEISLPPAGGG